MLDRSRRGRMGKAIDLWMACRNSDDERTIDPIATSEFNRPRVGRAPMRSSSKDLIEDLDGFGKLQACVHFGVQKRGFADDRGAHDALDLFLLGFLGGDHVSSRW